MTSSPAPDEYFSTRMKALVFSLRDESLAIQKLILNYTFMKFQVKMVFPADKIIVSLRNNHDIHEISGKYDMCHNHQVCKPA